MVNVCVDPRREEGVRVFSWVDEMGLSLIQETVVEKHNELQAIPEVLDSLDLSGAVVSIDAMGTQTAIAEQIIRSNADYVLVSRATRNICMRMSNLILQVNISIILTKPWRKIMVVLRSVSTQLCKPQRSLMRVNIFRRLKKFNSSRAYGK